MDSITYDCPYCLTHYVLWDDSMPPITAERNNDLWEAVRKQYDQVGSCKFCERKDPDIPTTAEMDGLYTQKDMQERFFVMVPCADCGQYNKQDSRVSFKPCSYCGGKKHVVNSTYWASLRTWNPKKKITAADRKRMGAA